MEVERLQQTVRHHHMQFVSCKQQDAAAVFRDPCAVFASYLQRLVSEGATGFAAYACVLQAWNVRQ
jgi:hypothetical protein